MKTMKTVVFVLAAALLLGAPFSAQEKKEYKNAKEAYEAARKAIYAKDWDHAIDRLEYILQQYKDNNYKDDSLYWLAYSLSKFSRDMGSTEEQIARQEEAIAKLNDLLKDFSRSKWTDDAKLLRLEIAEKLAQSGLDKYRSYINGTLKPTEENPELELKLVALNSLMRMDKAKAFPLLKKIVLGNENPRLRKQAIFILSQSDSDEVVPLMIKLAKEDKSPEIREQAVFWLGQRKSKEGLDALIQIYDGLTDPRLRKSVIFALSQNKDKKAREKLLSIAKSDTDVKIREQAIFWVGQQKDPKALDLLVNLYKTSKDTRIKKQLIFSIMQNKNPGKIKTLIDLARKEKNFEIKKQIVFWLGQSKDEAAVKFLKELIEK